VTASVAAEAYEDINGVIIESLMMPEAQLKSYLDNASSRVKSQAFGSQRRLRSLAAEKSKVTCRRWDFYPEDEEKKGALIYFLNYSNPRRLA
jgi:hypothetical protein